MDAGGIHNSKVFDEVVGVGTVAALVAEMYFETQFLQCHVSEV